VYTVAAGTHSQICLIVSRLQITEREVRGESKRTLPAS
jgi:hypothetical protein